MFAESDITQFYIYNLGFYALFPSLNGNPYPLTQLMAIELGILGAVILVRTLYLSACVVFVAEC
jgi:hypothetical protein